MASDRHRDRKTGSHERRIEDRTWEREADERNSEERKSDRHVDAFWERDTNYREGSEPKKSRPEERERDQSIYSTGNDRVVHRGRPHGERSEIDSEGARRRNLRVGAEYVSRYEHDKETSGARRTFPNAEDNAFHRLEFESNPRRGRSGGEYSEIKHDEVKRRASRVDSGSKSQYDRSSENVTNKREALGEQDPVAYYGTSKIPDYRTKATHGERAGSVRRQRYPGRVSEYDC